MSTGEDGIVPGVSQESLRGILTVECLKPRCSMLTEPTCSQV